MYESAPKLEFIWGGIKENSLGLIFGPSKSGKTTYCENLAMSLAMGKEEFFGKELRGEPQKVLFIGLEEFYLNRAERNLKQMENLSDEEIALLDENFLYQSTTFPRHIKSTEQWQRLKELISESKAEIVFIDSITRLNSGKLEDSRDAEKLIQNLRDLSQEIGVTIICIHHTPKLYDKEITLDSIKGSSVFAQETDFAIAIGRTSKNRRYLKQVYYRYANDNFDSVTELNLTENSWFFEIGEIEESKILSGTRYVKDSTVEECIINYVTDTSKLYTSNEIIDYTMNLTGLQKRQVQDYLSKMKKKNEILSLKKGVYAHINYGKDKNDYEGDSVQSNK